jgi:KDO2-lipid IV(A) lauroyltransferase
VSTRKDADEDESEPLRVSRYEILRGPKGWFAPLRLKLEVLGMRFLYWFVPLLPRETLIALGRALGRWGYHVSKKDRRAALANLDLAYGDTLDARAKRKIAKKSFESFGQVALELFWSRRLTDEVIHQICYLPKKEEQFVWDVMGRGKGMLVVACHLGSWEIMNLHASAIGFPTSTLVKRLRNDALNKLVTRNRRRTGSEVIYHDDAARGLLKAIRRKRAVPIPLDQNTRVDRGGVYVPFFGRPVAASRALALFALRTGAPVIGACCFPERGGRYRLEWGPEIEVPTEGTQDDRERELTRRCLLWIENVVRRRPDAWLWMYRRWKYRPTEDATGWPWYSKFVPENAPAPAGASS